MVLKNLLVWGFDSPSLNQAMAEAVEVKKFSVSAWFRNQSNGETPSIHELNTQPVRFLANYWDVNVPTSVYEAAYRYFPEYVQIYSRHLIVSSKSIPAICDMFRASIRIAYNIIIKSNIDAGLFCNMPHEGFDFILFTILRLLGRTTLVFYQSVIPEMHLILKNDITFNPSCLIAANNTPTNIKMFFSAGPENIANSLFYTKVLSVFPIPIGNRQLFYRVMYGLYLLSTGRLFRASNQFRFVDSSLNFLRNRRNSFSRKMSEKLTYIYFPLHLQPECTTTPMGGIFQDQLLAIELLAQILPLEWKIVVKENPRQGPSHREPEFFSSISHIKNVIPIRDINTHFLLKNAAAVATITGTVAVEAVSIGKPVIVFGNTYMKIIEGIFPFSDDLDLESIVKSHATSQAVDQSLDKLATYLHKGFVDDDYLKNSAVTCEQNAQLLLLSISRALTL